MIAGQLDGVGAFIDTVCSIRINFPTSGVFTASWNQERGQYLWSNGNLWTKQVLYFARMFFSSRVFPCILLCKHIYSFESSLINLLRNLVSCGNNVELDELTWNSIMSGCIMSGCIMSGFPGWRCTHAQPGHASGCRLPCRPCCCWRPCWSCSLRGCA